MQLSRVEGGLYFQDNNTKEAEAPGKVEGQIRWKSLINLEHRGSFHSHLLPFPKRKGGLPGHLGLIFNDNLSLFSKFDVSEPIGKFPS